MTTYALNETVQTPKGKVRIIAPTQTGYLCRLHVPGDPNDPRCWTRRAVKKSLWDFQAIELTEADNG